jgi:hypothetical protein
MHVVRPVSVVCRPAAFVGHAQRHASPARRLLRPTGGASNSTARQQRRSSFGSTMSRLVANPADP